MGGGRMAVETKELREREERKRSREEKERRGRLF